MKFCKSILSVVLVLTLLISTIVISKATEGKFITIDVVKYDEYGYQTVKSHAFYTDGIHLFASLETLEEYTFYYFDEQNNAFVRVGQEYSLSLSKTTLDFQAKKATVKMINGQKEYNLHDVIKFGDEYYLPLDQMCAFLMASVSFTDNKMTIRNSGFSIADAAYKFNNYAYVFNYNDIIDGIFAGNEDLYFTYCIIGFYGSSIFGLRIKNLDVITKSGDTEYYQAFLQDCITDYDEFLKTQADTDSFEKSMNVALSFTESLNGLISILKNGTTISKTAYETFSDTNDIANLDIQYIDAKNWSEVFGGLSKSLDYMEYFIKVASMTEDHKLMIRDCNEDSSNQTAGFQLNTAIINTFHQFGADVFTSILSKVADTLIEEVPEKAIKKFSTNLIPHIAVIKAVNLTFKLLGFDLSDNSQYSIMLEGLANSYLADRYSVLENDAGKTKEGSERFRRAAIFSLLASKHAFESGNALDKKLKSSGTLFDDELDVVCARLNLFYRAAESSCYENVDSIDAVIQENQKFITESNIINVSITINSPADINPEPDTLTDYIGMAVDEFAELWGEDYEVCAFSEYGIWLECDNCPFTPYIEIVGFDYLNDSSTAKSMLTGKEVIYSISADESCTIPVVKGLKTTEKLNTVKRVLGDGGRIYARGHTPAIDSYDIEMNNITYSFTWSNNGGATSLTEDDMNQATSTFCTISCYSLIGAHDVKTTTTTVSSVANENTLDLKELYRQFFFKNYTDKNLVYLFDVTHDGKDDMIVFFDDPQTPTSFDEYIVYTALNGKVEEIYRAVFHINRTNIMLIKKNGKSNFVYEFQGVWQGMGTASCEEFYISNSGEKKQVHLIEQEYDGKNYTAANDEYYGKIERRYGNNFSNAYMLYSTDAVDYATKSAKSTANENF